MKKSLPNPPAYDFPVPLPQNGLHHLSLVLQTLSDTCDQSMASARDSVPIAHYPPHTAQSHWSLDSEVADSGSLLFARPSHQLGPSANNELVRASMSFDYSGHVSDHQRDLFASSVSAHTSATAVSPKQKRKPVNTIQLRALNEIYAETAYPSAEQRAELAERLDLPVKRVQIWSVACPILRCLYMFLIMPIGSRTNERRHLGILVLNDD